MKGQLRINEMFAFIVIDEDGTEGIPAFTGPDGMTMPLVGADMQRVASLRPMAELLARQMKKTVTLVRFNNREDLEKIQ